MTCTLRGHVRYSATRDSEGHRDYKVVFEVAHDITDGPANILNTPGLPTYGAPFSILGLDDNDEWAYCRWDATVTPIVTKEANTYSEVEVLYSTKPATNMRMCRDTQFEDPLTEPQKISGSFVKYTEEATYDRFGQPVVNSAFEQIRGPQVEFDKSKTQIVIEQNVPDLELPLLCSMVDTVNEFPLWGMPARTIKLSNAPWERKFYGACYVYFTRKLTFDVDARTFDKIIMDEGTKVLNGHWNNTTGHYVTDPIPAYDGPQNPDPLNPAHFLRYKDRRGENTKTALNGAGLPADVVVGSTNPNLYVSVAQEDNKGNSLTNIAWWFPILNGNVNIPAWVNNVEYQAGQFVNTTGIGGNSVYIALIDNINTSPLAENETLRWQFVSTPATLSNRGNYDPLNTYQAGDYVAAPFPTSGIGQIRVENYDSSDFGLLNIPTDLTANF